MVRYVLQEAAVQRARRAELLLAYLRKQPREAGPLTLASLEAQIPQILRELDDGHDGQDEGGGDGGNDGGDGRDGRLGGGGGGGEASGADSVVATLDVHEGVRELRRLNLLRGADDGDDGGEAVALVSEDLLASVIRKHWLTLLDAEASAGAGGPMATEGEQQLRGGCR